MKTERPCPKCGEHEFEIVSVDSVQKFTCSSCGIGYEWADAWDGNFRMIFLKKGESYHMMRSRGAYCDLMVSHIDNSICKKVSDFFKWFFMIS